MSQYSPFGKKVQMALIRKGKNSAWLIDEVSKEVDMYVDSSVMSKIIHGKRNSPKIEEAIKKILKLEEKKDAQA